MGGGIASPVAPVRFSGLDDQSDHYDLMISTFQQYTRRRPPVRIPFLRPQVVPMCFDPSLGFLSLYFSGPWEYSTRACGMIHCVFDPVRTDRSQNHGVHKLKLQ